MNPQPVAPLSRAGADSGISLLRVVSALAVILLHAAAGVAGDVHRDFNRGWWAANILDAACRFCVPVFLMISGALLLGYTGEDVAFARRRLKRVVLPLFFWTFIYVLHGFLKNPQEALKAPLEFFPALWNALRNGVAYHVWYVYMLIGLLLFLPLLNAWVRQTSRKHLEIFLAIWILFILHTQPWFNQLLPQIDGHYFLGYGSYLILGYYLYHYRTLLHRYRWLPYALYALTVAVTAYGTFRVNLGRENFDELFYSYRSPGVVLMSASVFVAGLQFRNVRLPRWVQEADAASYGIYLVHILVMEYAWKIAIDLTALQTGRIVLQTIFTFLISFAAVWLLKRVKPLKTLVG